MQGFMPCLLLLIQLLQGAPALQTEPSVVWAAAIQSSASCSRLSRECIIYSFNSSSSMPNLLHRLKLPKLSIHLTLTPRKKTNASQKTAEKRSPGGFRHIPGQWMRYRSSCLTPRRSIVLSKAFKTASVPWASRGCSLDVKKMRGLPATKDHPTDGTVEPAQASQLCSFSRLL